MDTLNNQQTSVFDERNKSLMMNNIYGLTSKQWIVLCDLAQGLRVSEIAKRRHRSIKTISSHKCAALKHLRLTNNIELYQWLTYHVGLTVQIGSKDPIFITDKR